MSTAKIQRGTNWKGTIHIARLLSKAQRGRNALEKFLIQQNLIQHDLLLLILVGEKDLSESRFNQLWKEPLGGLVSKYEKLVAGDLNASRPISGLKEYNEIRKKLVHKMVFDYPSLEEIKADAKRANNLGSELLEKLFDSLENYVEATKIAKD